MAQSAEMTGPDFLAIESWRRGIRDLVRILPIQFLVAYKYGWWLFHSRKGQWRRASTQLGMYINYAFRFGSPVKTTTQVSYVEPNDT